MRLGALIFALALFIAPPLAGAEPSAGGNGVLVARPDAAVQSLLGRMEMLVDPDAALTIAEVSGGSAAGRFVPLPGIVGRGFVDGATWVRLRLRVAGPTPLERFLELRPPFLSDLRVFVPEAGAWHEFVLGNTRPYASRPVPFPSFVVPLVLPPDQEVEVFVRIKTPTPTVLSARLWSLAGLMNEGIATITLLGAFLGVGAMIIVINLAFWMWLRRAVYGYYAFYILALITINLGIGGLLFPLWPGEAHRIVGILLGTSISAALFADGLFTRALFKLGREDRALALVIDAAIVFGALATVLSLAGYYPSVNRWVQGSIVVLQLLCLALSLRLAARGHQAARLRTVAFLPTFLATTTLILRNQGLFPTLDVSDAVLLMGGLSHMILMTLALTQDVKRAERELQVARESALDAARDSERRAQRLAMERTSELSEAKGRLEVALAAERQAARDRVQFIDMVSHEYRTPLSVLRAGLDTLEMRMAGGAFPETERTLLRMRRAASRLIDIVEVGLDRARLDVDRLAATRRPVRLADCLAEAAITARNHHRDRVLTLISRPEDEGIMVFADKPLLVTVLINILDNALKYSEPDRPVSLSTVARALPSGAVEVEIRVIDQGVGIPSDERERVFEAFYRARTVGARPGTGIGLTLARRIVALHDGRIELDSRLGRGTTVTIAMPVSMTAARVPAQGEQA